MDDNVTLFPGVAVPETGTEPEEEQGVPTNEYLIRHLEEILEEAKAGEILAAAVVTSSGKGRWGNSYNSDDGDLEAELLAGLLMCQDRMVRDMSERSVITSFDFDEPTTDE